MTEGKRENTGCSGPLVACDGLAGDETERLENLIEILGARVWRGVGVPDLVFSGSSPSGIHGLRRVDVGVDCGLRIPGDEELLAHVILASSDTREGSAPPRIIAVPHWDAESSSAQVAQLLAETMRGVLVDLSGSGPLPALLAEPDAPGVRWADLLLTETTFPADLPAHLIKVGKCRVLTADARGGARLGDSRQRPVLDAISRSGTCAVINCGLWGEGAGELLGSASGLVLVGPADFSGAARAAFALALSPPPLPFVLVARGRGCSRLRALTTAPVVGWARALRGGGKAIVRALESARDERAGKGTRSG